MNNDDDDQISVRSSSSVPSSLCRSLATRLINGYTIGIVCARYKLPSRIEGALLVSREQV